VQDAYSLRCKPQVHGAARDALGFIASTLQIEMNAGTDNPMVFAETGELLSGGNFHGEPVAIAADLMSIAVAELGAISERRIERLVNPALSDLPAFLTRDGGLQSGLMLPHTAPGAQPTNNTPRPPPPPLDSIPTSANKEDHVSMGVTAARKAAAIVANVRRILAIELVAACQALELRRPLLTSAALQAAYARVRERVAPYEQDRSLADEVEALAEDVASGRIADAASFVCGTLD
jgi:histidine ammonia-lyase